MADTAEREPSGFRTILVEVEPAGVADHRIECAVRVAERFGAVLVGVGAELSPASMRLDPFNDVAALLNAQISADLAAAEENFNHIAGGVEREWRRSSASPISAMNKAACAADLIVAGGMAHPAAGAFRSADIGDLLIQTGRPVLITPPAGDACRADQVLIAWKDGREARRAVWDSLPFLLAAERVLVLAVSETDKLAPAEESAAEVALALRRHGVKAASEAQKKDDCGVADTLLSRAKGMGADLIVAGAYGHNRMGERVLGGVTRRFLSGADHPLLMSH